MSQSIRDNKVLARLAGGDPNLQRQIRIGLLLHQIEVLQRDLQLELDDYRRGHPGRASLRPIEDAERPYLKEMGAHLRLIRIERELSVAEVTTKSRLGKNTIRKIEGGQSRTRPETLKRILAAMDFADDEVEVIVDDLLEIVGPAIGRPKYDPTAQG